MFGDVLAVYEIDSHNNAWLEKIWSESDCDYQSHSISFDSKQIQLINQKFSNIY
jgi:hypothetical protein